MCLLMNKEKNYINSPKKIMSRYNIKKFIYNDYFIIFCVIILPWILLYTLDFKPKLFGDGEYIRESKLLVGLIKSKISFGDFYFTEGFFTIIYYAIPFSLISYNSTNDTYLIAAQLFNLIILLISFRLLLKLCSILKINKILFAIISLLNPIHIYYSFGILSEIPIFFTICVALYYFFKFIIQDNRVSFIIFSIFIFLSVSIRPNLILLLVLLVALLYINRKVLKFNYLIKNLLILTILFTIVLFSSLKFGKSVTSKLQKNQLDLLSFGAVMSTFQFFDEPTNWNFFNIEYRDNSKDYLIWIRCLDSLGNHVEANNLVYNKVFFPIFFKYGTITLLN